MSSQKKLEICEYCEESIIPGKENEHYLCRPAPPRKPATTRARAEKSRGQQRPPTPDTENLVHVPVNQIRGLDKVRIEDHEDKSEPDAVDAVLEQILESVAGPSPTPPEFAEKPKKEITPTMTQPVHHPANRASSFLRNLARTAKAQRATYLDRLTDIPTAVVILAQEVLPEFVTAQEEEDKERIQMILDGFQHAKNEHPELVSFIDLHNRMQAKKDPGLKIDFDRILETARAMQAANEVRNSGGELDEVQRDVLKSNLDAMAKKAMTDFNDRLAEAEKQRRRAAAKAYKDVEDMATTKGIIEALEAVEQGGEPTIVVHIGEKMPVPGLPNENDGSFTIRPLGNHAVTAWELRKDGETYRAYLKDQWGEVHFDKHVDPAVGEPGVFEFDLEFSLKAKEEQRKDPFHVIRYVCGRWIHAEKIARQKEAEKVAREEAMREAFQPYRDGVAQALTASDFLVGQEGGIFYTNVRFTMGPKQPSLHLEMVLRRQEKDGGVSLAVYTTETTHQDRISLEESLGRLQDQFVAAAVGKQNNKGEEIYSVLCEPVGLRRTLLKIPNDQKARLAILMRNLMGVEVQQETLREVIGSLDPHRVDGLAQIALQRNVFTEEKQRDEVQKMAALLVGPCAVLRRALLQALQDELAARQQSEQTEQAHEETPEATQEPEPEPVAASSS